ncbi:NAD(P)-binding domain-containing protein [Dioscorea alata]|uniref:NAD(P)-binding domain-containing protein n=1 Tax=Dioscorea alata TaxID=55571 RepID=A0ACB7UET0_DIOAL|nr:NAD(P)-binding domain-containing protein [Dioscorea alata]
MFRFISGGCNKAPSSTMNAIHCASPPPPPFSLPPAKGGGIGSQGNRLFVFGVGFVGRYVSNQLLKQGWRVSGTCTCPVRKRELEMMGMHDSFLFDANKNELESLHTLKDATHVLISIPPLSGLGDPLLTLHHKDLQSTLNHGNLQSLCYLSSTSVYGDCGGAWVDEDSAVNPATETAKARYAAEKGWQQLGCELDVPVNIFRLGGIYGCGRSAINTILQQKSLSREQKMRETKLYTARVHVADIYQALCASFNLSSSSGRVYNVVDDDPAPREVVFDFARDLIEKRWPEQAIAFRAQDKAEDTEFSHKSRKIGEEKRVSNVRIKKELGVRLLYPSYKSGLENILNSMYDDHS